ncbi:MAG TPA: acyl-CoA synthetase [Acidimicrobiales bacterium]|nr:acyl-CoA synthetase [Acidimicrobiales bacterium]
MFNHYSLFSAIAAAVPDRECVVFRDRRLTYADVLDRAHRLAEFLLSQGVTLHKERDALERWKSGQDHVALYLHNGNEYIEATFGANAARAVPFNVNYWYVEDELTYLLDDADAAVVVYHATFAPKLAAVVDRLRRRPLLIQVDDGSGNPLLPGAYDYEAVLAAGSGAAPDTEPSPDDLYIIYTGGTTGMPKGTLWTQAELFAGAIAPALEAYVADMTSMQCLVDTMTALPATPLLPMPPLMHGSAQWVAFLGLFSGATIVIQGVVDRFDAADVLTTLARERVVVTNIVGDAFARPLCDELERGSYDLSALTSMMSGGAVLSPGMKRRLLDLLPHVVITDAVGSSESGSLLSHVSQSGGDTSQGVFAALRDTCVVNEAIDEFLSPGHDGVGWLARRGPIPLGYLGDAAKTERTFPVVAGQRIVVPGDRARLRGDGLIELLGRDSVTINSGGEKVFAEEVEQALVCHPDVVDVLVVGRPSERWGQEVVAVVALRPESTATDADLVATAAARLARYKLPKAVVRVDTVRRGPAGKADYGWAREVAVQASEAIAR